MLQFVSLLLVAGNETTTNLIANAVHALLAHPGAARARGGVARAGARAGRGGAPLRLAGPDGVPPDDPRRRSSHGTRIPADTPVALLLGSANRDERVFPDPDRFDVAREPRGHLAFGFGPHFCMGAALARLEAKVALEALVPELVRCKPVGGPPPMVDSFLVRGRARLEVERVG